MQEIQLKFDAGRGSVGLSRITAVIGDRVGAMPKPTRRGYRFVGWFMSPDGDPDAPNARRITAETVLDASFFDGEPTDTVLVARWKKQSGAEAGKKNMLVTQKRAIVAIAILIVVLIGALIGATIISNIYRYEDTDGQTYTIKKHKGEFALFKDGELCDTGKDGNFFYYITECGNQIEIDPDTGEYNMFAVVDTDGTEQVLVVGTNQRILMFKQLTYDASSTNDMSRVIKSIEVHNQNGAFTVRRGTSGNRFVVDGHDTAVLNDNLFAQLSSGCGYTISQRRLENPVRLADGSIDYSEYGLAAETRVKLDENGEEILDKDGKPVTYEYKPTYYTVTTMNGDTYTVTLGDATVSGGSYYARFEDRNTIYTLASGYLDSAVLQPIEALVTPLLVTPMSLTTSVNVSDFIYRTDYNHEAIDTALIKALTGVDISTFKPDENGNLSEEDKAALEQIQKDYTAALEKLSDEEFAKIYDPILEANSRLVTHFTYIDLSERENTMNSSLPYQMTSEYMAGYLPNSDNIGNMLQKLQSMTFVGVAVLSPTAEDLETYGLDYYAHEFTFSYFLKNSDTKETEYYPNHFIVSEKTEDGLYYAYSELYDMIVCFAESQGDYLEWEEIDWYEREYFLCGIAHVNTIIVEGGSLRAPITFTLDNSASDQSNGIASDKLVVYANGKLMDYKLMVTKPSGSMVEETATYNFRRFFQALLTASMEGNADLTEEEMAALRQSDDDCILKLTILADDGKGNTMYNIYRFYRYTERKAYMTIEALESPTDKGNPASAQGKFYVLRSFCDKLIADANRFLNGEEIVVDSKN